ncbi:hypothetical protein MPTK2_2g13490 [Marchantia polymorpha subsp. ruderalis]
MVDERTVRPGNRPQCRRDVRGDICSRTLLLLLPGVLSLREGPINPLAGEAAKGSHHHYHRHVAVPSTEFSSRFYSSPFTPPSRIVSRMRHGFRQRVLVHHLCLCPSLTTMGPPRLRSWPLNPVAHCDLEFIHSASRASRPSAPRADRFALPKRAYTPSAPGRPLESHCTSCTKFLPLVGLRLCATELLRSMALLFSSSIR